MSGAETDLRAIARKANAAAQFLLFNFNDTLFGIVTLC